LSGISPQLSSLRFSHSAHSTVDFPPPHTLSDAAAQKSPRGCFQEPLSDRGRRFILGATFQVIGGNFNCPSKISSLPSHFLNFSPFGFPPESFFGGPGPGRPPRGPQSGPLRTVSRHAAANSPAHDCNPSVCGALASSGESLENIARFPAVDFPIRQKPSGKFPSNLRPLFDSCLLARFLFWNF